MSRSLFSYVYTTIHTSISIIRVLVIDTFQMYTYTDKINENSIGFEDIKQRCR